MTITREKFKTYGSVFDEKTRLALRRLQNKRIFDELLSPIFVGKESNVFSAVTKKGDLVCVKIYRVNTCDFKKMYKYISEDKRFDGMQRNRRTIIFTWAKREYSNLKAAKKVGALVPIPLAVYENVLVMEFIGSKGPAPKLKDSNFNAFNYSRILIDNLKLLYKKAKLVHGDLSEFNLLDFQGRPYIIDLSHGMKIGSPNAPDYLKRDVENLVRFFNRKGLKLNVDSVLKEIVE